MRAKVRILDSYFLSQIKKKGINATEKEVTRFFEETGWKFYDLDSMLKNFNSWRKIQENMEVRVE